MADQSQEQEQVQKPAPPMQIEKLTQDLLQSQGEKRVTTLSAEHEQKAQALAAALTLDNFNALIEYMDGPLGTISGASQAIIGDTRLGDVKVVGDLFSRFRKAGEKLDVQSIHQDPNFVIRLLMRFNTAFEPIYRFLEQYKEVRAVIQEQRGAVEQEMLARDVAKKNLEQLKQGVFAAFDDMAIAIRAGEIFLARSVEEFTAKQAELQGSTSIAELSRLKDMRRKIVLVDEEILGLQIARLDAIQDLSVIDICIQNEEQLRKKLHTILHMTIPQLEKSVAIACAIYGQRNAMKLGLKIEEYTEALREANMKALGLAQDELHDSRMRKMQQAEEVINNLESLAQLITDETAKFDEYEQAAQKVRQEMTAAEEKFRRIIEDDLKKVASTPISE